MRWIWNTGLWLSSAMAVSGWKRTRHHGRAARMLERLSGSVAAEQGHQSAAPVEFDQLVAAADVGLANEDLRNGVATGPLDHLGALRRIDVEANLVERLDAALFEERLRALAVRAPIGAVHPDRLHGLFATGRQP